MGSPLTQKPKAEPEGKKKRYDEDKYETYTEIDDQRFKNYQDTSTAAQDSIAANPNPAHTRSQVMDSMKNADDKAYQAYQEKMAHSMDSLNRVTNNDIAAINALWEDDKLTGKQYEDMMKGQKKIGE
jgi:hypothetical protein